MSKQMNLKVSAVGDTDIVMTREFKASLQAVFDAHTKPELIRRWLLGPDGWDMPVCEVELKVGGKYRYVWRRRGGPEEMGMGGVFKEVVSPTKLVQTEKFDHAWYPGHAICTLELSERSGVTTLRNTVRYETKEARDGVLKSPMATGVEASYNRLASICEI